MKQTLKYVLSFILGICLITPAISTPIDSPKLESFAQATPPVSSWGGSIYYDIRHSDAAVVLTYTITTQHDVIMKGLNFDVRGFSGPSLLTGNMLAGFSAGMSRTISREGSTIYLAVAVSSGVTKKVFDVGGGVLAGVNIKF